MTEKDIIEAAERAGDEGSENGEEEEEVPIEEVATGSKQKKKKKKSKASRALAALRGKESVPQEIVDEVLRKVTEEIGEDTPGADEAAVRKALDYLKINDVIKGKAGLGGRGRKDMGEHKFWSTQPVPHGEEHLEDGYIEPSIPADQVRQEPYPLPKDFEWSTIDINDPAQLTEVYELLSAHYVEDHDASFRFKYTASFLLWALKPPNYVPEWHLGVRVASNKKLVAFISGVPFTIRVRENTFATVEINFLCVHKKLRSKRLAPVLIKEITRQCHLKGIFQAIYTSGVVLPTPVATCRYYHRPLNVPKLVDIRFTSVPRSSTIARMIRLHKLADMPHLSAHGLREAEERDISGILQLFKKFMRRYDMAPEMTLEEAKYSFLSGKGKGEIVNGRREDQVIWTYVVEDPQTKKLTDFFSFYTLPSTVIGNTKYGTLEAAYMYYYASDVAFYQGDDMETKLGKRLQELVGDALIIADKAKFDVFNALSLMDNWYFLQDLKFGSGDGLLNFYLYNWRTAPLSGINPCGGRGIGQGVGVVML